MKKIIFSILIGLICFGCKDDKVGKGEPVFCKSYILDYYKIDELKLEQSGEKTINIHTEETSIANYYGYKTELYQQLCDKYTDNSYNRTLYNSTPLCNEFLNHRFVSMEVITEKDWDNRLAGSSIADLCMVYTFSPYRYIQNGYEDFDWISYEYLKEFSEYYSSIGFDDKIPNWYYSKGTGALYPSRNYADKLSPDDLTLLGCGIFRHGPPLMVIRLTELPFDAQNIELTVILTDDAGETYSASIVMQ